MALALSRRTDDSVLVGLKDSEANETELDRAESNASSSDSRFFPRRNSATGRGVRGSDEDELALATAINRCQQSPPARKCRSAGAPVATVITAQDIEAIGASDLDEVLETVPGLHVARGTQTNTPIYSIRGIFSDTNPQVLMLVNGIPVTSAFTGNRGNGWGGLPLDNIERIEVIRGPGSALYGADAFSGVINLITKTATDIDGTRVRVPGIFNTTTPGLSIAAVLHLTWGLLASRQYRDT